tara:strand:+ start:1248 stop:2483 length:1236 start_codon:yes stop_codon:yes gene_type:complete
MINRVAVTGMGIISPLGNSVNDFWNAIKIGKNGIRNITQFDTSNYHVHIAGECDIDLDDYLDSKQLNKIDRFTAFAIIAANEAIKDSGFNLEYINQDKAGVIVGSGIGGMHTFEAQHTRLLKSPRRVSPFFIPSMIPDIASGYIALNNSLKGINYSVVSACASGTHSIGDAFRSIKHGYSDIVVAGGTEASITPMAIAGFSNMKALSKNPDPNTASRPFDLNRDGFVISEGAGILVLENLEHALKRNANIYAEIKGFGASADAYHITSPHPEAFGAIQSMQQALNESDLNYTDVDYINAHGTSTKYNDMTETKAIKTIFKEHSKNLSISSTKSMIGHCLGASGALEAIATILSINQSTIAPTINYSESDPECDLDYTPNKSVDKEINNALSNSFGFGGHNGTLAFGKYNRT